MPLIRTGQYSAAMPTPTSRSLTAILFILALIRPAAAATADLDQEYAQVRKIALKDPKVQEAFRKANERLNERILEIDPSLKQVVQRHQSTPVAATQGTALETRPASTATPEGRHHIVAKGETLSSIATHYKVKVSTLETVNHITDDRKLQVGQNLLIPSSEAVHPQPSPASQDSQPQDAGNLWDRLKSGL